MRWNNEKAIIFLRKKFGKRQWKEKRKFKRKKDEEKRSIKIKQERIEKKNKKEERK